MLVQNRRGFFTLFLAEPAALYITMSVTSKLLSRYFFFLSFWCAILKLPHCGDHHQAPDMNILFQQYLWRSLQFPSHHLQPLHLCDCVWHWQGCAGRSVVCGGSQCSIHESTGGSRTAKTQPCPGNPVLGVLQPPRKATSLVSEIVLWAPLLLNAQAQVPINF